MSLAPTIAPLSPSVTGRCSRGMSLQEQDRFDADKSERISRFKMEEQRLLEQLQTSHRDELSRLQKTWEEERWVPFAIPPSSLGTPIRQGRSHGAHISPQCHGYDQTQRCPQGQREMPALLPVSCPVPTRSGASHRAVRARALRARQINRTCLGTTRDCDNCLSPDDGMGEPLDLWDALDRAAAAPALGGSSDRVRAPRRRSRSPLRTPSSRSSFRASARKQRTAANGHGTD